MSDLVKQLRSIDHMSVEDCFLQSYLYTKAADRIEELEAKLAEVEAKLVEEERICTMRGNVIEFDLTPSLADAEARLADVEAERDEQADRIEDLEHACEVVSAEFEGELWQSCHRLLKKTGFDFHGADVNGIHADDFESHMNETLAAFDREATRADEAEAMLPRAWMDGMEAAVANILEQQARCEEQTMKLGGVEGRENDWHRWSGGDLSLGLSATTIRAQPIPTSAELLAKLKETT
jgi:uncharacterized coiled-coil protein SlyX